MNENNINSSGCQVSQKKPIFPLSSGQEGLWFIEYLNKDNYTYNVPNAFRIKFEINADILKDTVKAVLERHSILCAKFMFKDQKPVQEIQSADYFFFETDQLEHLSDIEIQDFLIKKVRKPFDLENDPLFRVHLFSLGKQDYILLFNIHHIVFDGSSLIILLRELFHFYIEKLTGVEKAIYPVNNSYSDFVEWQFNMINSSEGKQHRDFWLEKLSGELPSLSLPYDKPGNNMSPPQGKSYDFFLPAELTNKIQRICQEEEVTPFVFMLSAFNVLLFRYTTQQDIIVGTAVHGRPGTQFKNVIGYFMNMILIRSKVSGEMKFLDLLQQVNKNSMEAFAHCDYPFIEIVRQKGGSNNRGFSPLMQVAFIFQNWFTGEYQFSSRSKNSVSVDFGGLELIPGIHQEGEFDLSLEIIKTANSYNALLKYNYALFDTTTIVRMAEHYVHLLNEIVIGINRNISDLDITTFIERETILNKFNNTKEIYPVDKCIHILFEEQVRKKPGNIAVIYEGAELSYDELNKKANQLARILRDKGLGRNDIAAIITERSLEMMIGLFAILKAGGAYLPVSPGFPQERIEYILENSKAKIILVSDKSIVDFPLNKELVEITNQEIYTLDDSNLSCINSSSDLAYVIYTSGTTGNPKGAMIEHHSLVNRLKWMQDAYQLIEEDTILQKTPYTFDVSVWELFWWSLEGAKVCLLKPDGEKYPEEIVAAIEKNNITVMHFVPSMLDIFLSYIKSVSAPEKIASLKQVFASGEALTVSQVTLFNKLLLKRNSTKLMNLYGPTEATIDVSYFDCSVKDTFDLIPIGRPISNIKLYIINKYNKLQPIGLPGELCIAGAGLARGYLHNQKMTDEKFIVNPFEPRENPFEPGTLMYKTGDLARWLPDGNIEYLGRIDRQIKIRGFRIELEEIEEALNKYKDILKSVVILDDKKDFSGSQQLKAFIITKDNQEISRKLIKEYLMKKLPEYMVPASIDQVKAIPLTAHGKVDRKALLNLTFKEQTAPISEYNENDDTGEVSEIKKIVNTIFQQVLNRENINPATNFFDLGGHSLLMIKMGMMLKEQLNSDISTVELFQYPTIESLTNYLSSKGSVSFEQSQKRGKTQREMLKVLNKKK